MPDDGLTAFGEDSGALMLALARPTVSGEEAGAESAEHVFSQARDAEAKFEELLVDARSTAIGFHLLHYYRPALLPGCLIVGPRVWNRWRKVGILAIIPVAMRPESGTNAPG